MRTRILSMRMRIKILIGVKSCHLRERATAGFGDQKIRRCGLSAPLKPCDDTTIDLHVLPVQLVGAVALIVGNHEDILAPRD